MNLADCYTLIRMRHDSTDMAHAFAPGYMQSVANHPGVPAPPHDASHYAAGYAPVDAHGAPVGYHGEEGEEEAEDYDGHEDAGYEGGEDEGMGHEGMEYEGMGHPGMEHEGAGE